MGLPKSLQNKNYRCGWVNIYRNGDFFYTGRTIYPTRKEAGKVVNEIYYFATVKVTIPENPDRVPVQNSLVVYDPNLLEKYIKGNERNY